MANPKFINTKRRGYMLMTAVIIMLLLGTLGVAILAFSYSVYNMDTLLYEDNIIQAEVEKIIEETKAFIVAFNNSEKRTNTAGGIVLHGHELEVKKGTPFPIYGFPLFSTIEYGSLDDLQVNHHGEDNKDLEILKRDVQLSPGTKNMRFARLRVFDANYLPEKLKNSVPKDADLPPSLYKLNRDVNDGDVYAKLGAYLIRVDVYNQGQSKPFNRTEELFYMFLSNADSSIVSSNRRGIPYTEYWRTFKP